MAMIVCEDEVWLTSSFSSSTAWPISVAIVVPRESSGRKQMALSRKKNSRQIETVWNVGR